MESSYLLSLPVELFHRILDRLDISDILLSFRCVCKKFHSITNSYNRLTLELSNHASEKPIDRFYRLVLPSNVEILLLRKCYSNVQRSNIDWFFSAGDLHRLTRLRSVRLENLYENEFRTIMRHLATLSTLQSLTISSRGLFKTDTIVLLSTVIALASLCKLDLDTSSRIIDELCWPNHGTLREVILQRCSYQQWCQLLQHSPNLRIVSLTDLGCSSMNKTDAFHTYEQLISLTLNEIQFSIEHLEMLLSSCPSLIDLNFTANQLTSTENLRRFSTWESFIRTKLPRLKTFYFRISTRMSRAHDLPHIKSIIAAFRTPFWLTEKCWYAQFQCAIHNQGARFIIQSSRHGHGDYFQNFHEAYIAYFTSTTKDDDGPRMCNRWNAFVNLPAVTNAIRSRRFTIDNHYLFANVIRLGLDIDCYDDWKRSGSFELLSKLIDLSQLREIWYLLSCKQTFQASTINTILEKAPNVRTFGIKNNGSLRSNFEEQCAVISSQINHLIIRSTDTSTMNVIVKHVEHLSTITFTCEWSSSTTWTKMIQWLREKDKTFSITDDHRSIHVWMKKPMDP